MKYEVIQFRRIVDSYKATVICTPSFFERVFRGKRMALAQFIGYQDKWFETTHMQSAPKGVVPALMDRYDKEFITVKFTGLKKRRPND